MMSIISELTDYWASIVFISVAAGWLVMELLIWIIKKIYKGGFL